MVPLVEGNIVDCLPSGTLSPSAIASGDNVSLGETIHNVTLNQGHHLYNVAYYTNIQKTTLKQSRLKGGVIRSVIARFAK